MSNNKIVNELVEKSKIALKEFEGYTQKQVDALVRGIARAVYDNAEILAKEAIEETRMGVYEDKIGKTKGTAEGLWKELKGKLSVGIIRRDPVKKLVFIAKPKGIIVAVSPTTNPIMTPMGNAMLALKGRNTVIIAPHPRSKKVSTHTVQIMNEALRKLGAPENLIQIVEEPSVEITQHLMSTCDTTIATGGMGMVKAAYSSGKPSFGVGAGNVQTILDRDADYEKAAQQSIFARTLDNGVICAGNQSIITPVEKHAEIMEVFIKNGAYYVEDEVIVDKFRNVLFKDGAVNGKAVGQSVQFIANLAGVEVPEETKVIILKAKGKGREDVLCQEKMAPVMITLTYDTFEEAVDIAEANLLYCGAGHSTVVYSDNVEHIEYAGLKLPVCRLVVNQPGIAAAAGLPSSGLTITTTLGCGSWGNNSLSENLTYEHLLNVIAIAYEIKNPKVPTSEEIWG